MRRAGSRSKATRHAPHQSDRALVIFFRRDTSGQKGMYTQDSFAGKSDSSLSFEWRGLRPASLRQAVPAVCSAKAVAAPATTVALLIMHGSDARYFSRKDVKPLQLTMINGLVGCCFKTSGADASGP